MSALESALEWIEKASAPVCVDTKKSKNTPAAGFLGRVAITDVPSLFPFENIVPDWVEEIV
jgi:hypothetical protein